MAEEPRSSVAARRGDLRERSGSAPHRTLISKQAESRTKAILKAFPDLIFVLSPDGIFLESHSSIGADLLMPPEEFIGRAMQDVLPAEMAKTFRAAFARAAETPEVIEVDYMLTIGGEQRHFEARLVRRDDGAMVAVVRDVTERHQAASKLRDSEQQFRVAFTHSSIGMALVSLEGRFLRVNAALCRILGYTDSELLRDHIPGVDSSRGSRPRPCPGASSHGRREYRIMRWRSATSIRKVGLFGRS